MLLSFLGISEDTKQLLEEEKTWQLKTLYWFSVNWKFPMSELTYSAKGDFDEKEALQLSA